MYYNLFGDYVKGSDLSRFPEKVQKGLRLHREIDNYVDHHPIVVELLHELYPSLPKISGVAVDLYFDHLLAKFWSDYHPTPLEDYLAEFYQTIPKEQEFFSEDFNFLLSKMIPGKWINQYHDFKGLTMVCTRLSARIPFENVLYKAPDVFVELDEEINRAFRLYMKDAIKHFNHREN
jgi:acyl carrier protein phosphodiesterase